VLYREIILSPRGMEEKGGVGSSRCKAVSLVLKYTRVIHVVLYNIVCSVVILESLVKSTLMVKEMPHGLNGSLETETTTGKQKISSKFWALATTF
jgi:hypothetical protein